MAIIDKYENESDIPEENKDDYEAFEDDGKTVFVLKPLIGALTAKRREKEERKKAAEAVKAMEAKTAGVMREMEAKIAEYARIEEEKQAALEAEKLRQLEKDKNWEEIEKINKEKRDTERAAQLEQIRILEESVANMKLEKEEEKVAAICSKVAASIGITGEPGAIEALGDAIKYKRTKTVNGEVIILNKDGQAVEWDNKQLADDVKNDPYFARLVAGSKASGGAGGGSNFSGGTVNKTFDKYTEQERVQLFRENPEKFRELVAAEKNKG